MTESKVEYRVGLPNGVTWIYTNKVKAENAALIARGDDWFEQENISTYEETAGTGHAF